MTSDFLPGQQLREPHLLPSAEAGLEDVILPDEAARWECPALGGDLLVQSPELCLRLQQLVACAPVFARLAGEVDIRVEEYFRHLFMSRGLPLTAIVSVLSYVPNSLPCFKAMGPDRQPTENGH